MPETAAEVLDRLTQSRAISPPEADEYRANIAFFDACRGQIAAEHDGEWVAAAGNRVLVASSLEALQSLLREQPGGNRAYIEFMGIAET